jgi:hypothetical protein
LTKEMALMKSQMPGAQMVILLTGAKHHENLTLANSYSKTHLQPGKFCQYAAAFHG